MKIMILANGQPPSPEVAHKYALLHDKVIVTDGAADAAILPGLSIDMISGDFDSVENLDSIREAFPNAEIVRTPDQDYGDLEKAILLAIKQGATRITIAGAGNRLSGKGGGRVDHMLANYALLLRYHNSVSSLKIIDDWSELRAVSGTKEMPGELTINTKSGDRISLISFINGTQVTITGVKWPLDNFLLPIGARAISNEAQSNQVYINVQEGMLFVCHLPVYLPQPG
jgi:thiamine pyrophosphokinase